jgi:SAM-dependent methyltransferase
VGDLGEVAGRLYSWNTLGSLLGALIGGYALLFWLDLHHTYRIAMGAVAVAAALMTMHRLQVGRSAPAVLLAVTLAAIAMLPAWRSEQLSSGTFRKRSALANTFNGPTAFYRSYRQGKLHFYDDDPIASVSVKAFETPGSPQNLAIITNGKSDGAIPGDAVTTILLALIPALIAREPARSFVVGYGTGVTAGELAALEDVREVTVAEISPGVIEAAPQFDYGNLGASKNPKVRIVRGDAYRTLLRSQGEVDLIVSEPSNPWVTGIEMLYSQEFLEACRDRLTPGGVHAQWFHSYETDDATLAILLRTYQSVFPHSSVWFTVGTDLLLIGVNDPEGALDLARMQRRFERPDFKAGFERAKISSFPALLGHEMLPLDVLAATPLPGPLHTLLHPILSNSAARAFFSGGYGKLPVTSQRAPAEVGKRNSLLRRYAAAQEGGQLSEIERVRVVEETCRHASTQCAAVMARWIVETPESPVRDRMRGRLARNQMIARSGRLNAVGQLVWLYDDAPKSLPEHVAAAQATQASQLYAELYHHGVPFSRERLIEMLRRCESDPKQEQACLPARTNIERTLGDLDE